MPALENTPLLGSNGGASSEGHPTFLSSFRWIITSSWLNLFCIFIPLGIVAEKMQWDAVWIFSLNFLAIVPLAKLLGDATEQAALKLGSTLGGLLNATFGNAVELIVGVVALFQGQLRIVQTSLIGSILSNILLVLGMSFAFGGVHFTENTFQQTAAQASGSIMMLSVVAIALPAAYQGGAVAELFGKDPSTQPGSTEAGILFISRGTSVVLLLVYMLYLFFQLKSHAFLYEGEEGDQEEEETPQMTPLAAVVALGVITVITSFSADYLVGAIDETANEYGIPKAFISTILLPIIGNAAEHTTSCLMAYKGKMEIAIGVSVGSSIQIAMGLLPTLIIVAWIIGQPLTLYFQTFETVVLVSAVILVNSLIQDGRSNYMEGMMLFSLYVVAALCFWVS
ncbi:calcium/proton exchanger [Microstroma glucosiphilum]|uniref:Vacuolar calcium ion transporter n=1 Tax=Pseudomicrostroma glucosiphilum TaxID=1684307 RepID=A0A316UG79_9BASI|nr:calcium/proton exchanger [Pseudomicrostroma glucosiphilum]PWN23948.1 calcium/proton exchanger [Pseudomicrostroma glucosiphilum]